MIKQTHRKIHFAEYVPERGREKDTDAPPTVTISRKNNTIKFPSRTIAILGMEGSFVSFYYESTRKIIGWTIREGLSEALLSLKKYRLVKPGKNGEYHTTISGILRQFNGSLTKDSYKKLEIKKYVEQEGVLQKGDVYYYVQLTDDYEATDA